VKLHIIFLILMIGLPSIVSAATFDPRFSCYAPFDKKTYNNCVFLVKYRGTSIPMNDDCITSTVSSDFRVVNKVDNTNLRSYSPIDISGANDLVVRATAFGEYFDCGGWADSPPVYFGTSSDTYYYNPKFNGGSCGKVETQMVCSTATTVIITNLVTKEQIVRTSSEANVDIPIGTLTPGTYTIEIKRDYTCYFSGRSAGCPLASPSPSKTSSDTESFHISVSGNKCASDNSCDSGYTCCNGYCYDSTTGVCRDIFGNDIPIWVLNQ